MYRYISLFTFLLMFASCSSRSVVKKQGGLNEGRGPSKIHDYFSSYIEQDTSDLSDFEASFKSRDQKLEGESLNSTEASVVIKDDEEEEDLSLELSLDDDLIVNEDTTRAIASIENEATLTQNEEGSEEELISDETILMAENDDKTRTTFENESELKITNKHTELNFNIKSLIRASRLATPESLRYLIHTKGIDVNGQSTSGKTAIIEAVIHKRVDNLKALLKLKADPLIEDRKGRNAVDYARENGLEDFFQN